MSKTPHTLIVTRLDPATGRATETTREDAKAFAAAHPDLAEAVKRVIRTGATESHPGLYLARGAR